MGTLPDDWIRSVNHIISSFRLNGGRKYSRIELVPGYAKMQKFYEIVSRSLIKNVPVAIAFTARSQESLTMFETRHNFILVTSVTGMAETAKYSNLDPTDGIRQQFSSIYLVRRCQSSDILAQLRHCSSRHFRQKISHITRRQCRRAGKRKVQFLTALTSVCPNLGLSKRAAYRPT